VEIVMANNTINPAVSGFVAQLKSTTPGLEARFQEAPNLAQAINAIIDGMVKEKGADLGGTGKAQQFLVDLGTLLQAPELSASATLNPDGITDADIKELTEDAAKTAKEPGWAAKDIQNDLEKVYEKIQGKANALDDADGLGDEILASEVNEMTETMNDAGVEVQEILADENLSDDEKVQKIAQIQQNLATEGEQFMSTARSINSQVEQIKNDPNLSDSQKATAMAKFISGADRGVDMNGESGEEVPDDSQAGGMNNKKSSKSRNAKGTGQSANGQNVTGGGYGGGSDGGGGLGALLKALLDAADSSLDTAIGAAKALDKAQAKAAKDPEGNNQVNQLNVKLQIAMGYYEQAMKLVSNAVDMIKKINDNTVNNIRS
jgi:hypothetical protein